MYLEKHCKENCSFLYQNFPKSDRLNKDFPMALLVKVFIDNIQIRLLSKERKLVKSRQKLTSPNYNNSLLAMKI